MVGIFFGGDEEEEDGVVCFATPAREGLQYCTCKDTTVTAQSSCHRWLGCLILQNANRHKTNRFLPEEAAVEEEEGQGQDQPGVVVESRHIVYIS